MTVRIFVGWNFEETEVVRPDFAAQGYARGVPMGGDLTSAAPGEAPTLMVRALRDPDGANLDRIQIIKGWVDAAGEMHERIYDIACADDRPIRQRRCAREVGNTVDVEQATFTNDIGDALLAAWWQDPEFNSEERAFYGDAIELPEDALLIHQERAYTSPIWYTP